jgi:hypothetical protein
MSAEYEVQPLAWVVKPKGDTVDCDASTKIERTHEGDGQFLSITQVGGEIRISLEEWPKIQEAIQIAFDQILTDELHEFAPKDKP